MSIANNESGALMGLVAKGLQDIWINRNRRQNTKDMVYNLGGFYQVIYGLIDHTNEWYSDRCKIKINMDNFYDFINVIDLHIDDSIENISKVFKNITAKVDDQIFDTFDSWEQVITVAAIHGRKVTSSMIGDQPYCTIPIALAPLHKHNFIRNNCIEILIEFVNDTLQSKVFKLFGNKHYVENYNSLRSLEYEFITFQSQCCCINQKIQGFSNSYRLQFNFPVTHIYFWGFDKTKVSNVKLSINGNNLYNGPLGTLEHEKERRGLGDISACIIFLCEDNYTEAPFSSVNFSRIEFSALVLDIQDNDMQFINIAAVNIAGVQFKKDKYKLIFES